MRSERTIGLSEGARSRRARLAAMAALLVAAPLAAAPLAAQSPASLPFQVGEELTYRVRVSGVDGKGHATMKVDGPADVRGTETWRLSFVVKTKVGFLSAENRSESWIDPVRMASVRFHKLERQPLSKHRERVNMFPESRAFEVEGGASGTSGTDEPLDELSFIYFLRTVPLADGATYQFDRHFDPARNPVSIRVVKRELLATPAGAFPAVVVEMRVRDPKRYGDRAGVLLIHFSDDHCRLPLRIESDVPMAGRAILTLESRGAVPPAHLAGVR